MVADDFVLTTNAGAFPPAVAITNPVNGLAVDGAGAADGGGGGGGRGRAGLGEFLRQRRFDRRAGDQSALPSGVDERRDGRLRVDGGGVEPGGGLTRTSAVVNVTVLPPAYQFGILTGPASLTNAVGSSATFTVSVTGTNAVTYQW